MHTEQSMLDGYSEIGAHDWSDLGYLNCLRHLLGPRAVTNLIFFLKKRHVFFHTCAPSSELTSKMAKRGTKIKNTKNLLISIFGSISDKTRDPDHYHSNTIRIKKESKGKIDFFYLDI